MLSDEEFCNGRNEATGAVAVDDVGGSGLVDVTQWQMGEIGTTVCMAAGEYVTMTNIQAGAQYTFSVCSSLEGEILTGAGGQSDDPYLLLYDMEGATLVERRAYGRGQTKQRGADSYRPQLTYDLRLLRR